MGADGRRARPSGSRASRSSGLKKRPDPAARLAALEAVCVAIAHPARRQILLAVALSGGEANAGYIARRFSCSWPTVSRHLRVLEDAGLLEPKRQGRERIYDLNREALGVLEEWLKWFRHKPGREPRGN